MPSIELNKLQAVTGPRALSETDRTLIEARQPSRAQAGDAGRAVSGVSLEISAAIDTAQPPVDTDRIIAIREALRDGTYPLVPTKIADAMIAARLSAGIRP